MNNILLFAHPKTGQHWIIWLLGNYQQLTLGREPIGWIKVLEFSKFGDPNDKNRKGCIDIPADKLVYKSAPMHFARIEYPYKYNTEIDKFIDSFDKKAYLYRNPFDVMISMYYYFQNNIPKIDEILAKKDLKGDQEFETYARNKIDVYINHVRDSIDEADLVLYYDDLLLDPSPFRELIGYFYNHEFNEDLFQKTLHLSSFDHVSKLERDLKKQQFIEEKKDRNEFHIFHTRNGRSGQYKNLMSQELIEYITQKWDKLKKEVKYKLK